MTDAAPPPPPKQLPPPSQPTRLSPKTAEAAVTALLKWRKAKSMTEKPQLLEHDEFVYLVVTLKKIPQTSRTNPYRIRLPHALINPIEDSPELCLIIDDRPKSGLTKDAAMKKIKSEHIPISKVIKLSKLKTDYRPFESKRKLCDSYDKFFADRRVIPLLPRLLGKQFFKSKKIPVAINLKHRNWKEQIEKASGAAMFFTRTGTCSVVKVGKLSMESNEITENVVAAVNGIADIVASKWKNIRSLHLKLSESLALPIYQTMPDLKLKIDASVNEKGNKEENVGDELAKTDADDSKSNDESVSTKTKKKKGKIHEVRYMDSNISETLDEEEIGVNSEDDVPGGEDTESDEMGIGESGDKKRKKVGKAVKTEKPPKKVAKEKKSGDLKLKEKSEDGLKSKKQRKDREEPGGGLKEKKRKKSTIRN